VFEFKNIAEVKPKYYHLMIQGSASVLKCEVLGCCSRGGLPRSQNKLLHPEEVLATKDRLIRSSSWVASFLLPCDNPEVEERGFGPMFT
jgi:hypothetical protein